MEIKTKYDVGQSVYIVNKHTKVLEQSESCDLCFGDGKIKYGSYSLQCPKCNGKGKLIKQRKQVDAWEVMPEHKVIAVKISVTNVSVSIRYKLENINGSVPEELTFTSEIEAQQFCQEHMQESISAENE